MGMRLWRVSCVPERKDMWSKRTRGSLGPDFKMVTGRDLKKQDVKLFSEKIWMECVCCWESGLVGPIHEFVTKEFQKLSQNLRRAISRKWCELYAMKKPNPSALLAKMACQPGLWKRSSITQSHGGEVPVCAVCFNTCSDVVIAWTISPLTSQMAKQLTFLRKLQAAKSIIIKCSWSSF